MRRKYPLVALVVGIVIAVAVPPARCSTTCGNGTVEGGEECDPGGGLFCDGNPSLSPCTTGAQCGGSTNCYFAFSCCKFNCQFVGQGATCFDGNQCTDGDHCDNVGRCVGQFKADGTACDDGLFCNGADTCQTGDCAGHAGDPCMAATDCTTTCNESAHACESTPFVPCGDDGNACTDDVCDGTGTCTHPPLPLGTVCRPPASICDLAEVCPGGGAPCPSDAFVLDGTPCGDLCTTNGTCQAGSCAQGVPLECDDHNVCNGLETCDPLTGCHPGVPLDCDDGNACTLDSCDPVGGCTHVNAADGAPCDDGDLCTIIDVCSAGTCQGQPLEFLTRRLARLGTQSTLDGTLVVNDPAGRASLGSFASMTPGSLLTANSVSLGKAASAFDVDTNLLHLAPEAVVTGTVAPATLPVLSTWCDLPPGSACGGPDVHVDTRAVVRIDPGSYGAVTVFDRGTLELNPGTYDFCSLRTVPPAAIRPRGNVVVRIHGDLKVARFGLFEPYAGTSQVWVTGKAKFSTSSAIHHAVLRTPESQTTLGRLVVLDGSLCADSLRAQRNVALACPGP